MPIVRVPTTCLAMALLVVLTACGEDPSEPGLQIDPGPSRIQPTREEETERPAPVAGRSFATSETLRLLVPAGAWPEGSEATVRLADGSLRRVVLPPQGGAVELREIPAAPAEITVTCRLGECTLSLHEPGRSAVDLAPPSARLTGTLRGPDGGPPPPWVLRLTPLSGGAAAPTEVSGSSEALGSYEIVLWRGRRYRVEARSAEGAERAQPVELRVPERGPVSLHLQLEEPHHLRAVVRWPDGSPAPDTPCARTGPGGEILERLATDEQGRLQLPAGRQRVLVDHPHALPVTLVLDAEPSGSGAVREVRLEPARELLIAALPTGPDRLGEDVVVRIEPAGGSGPVRELRGGRDAVLRAGRLPLGALAVSVQAPGFSWRHPPVALESGADPLTLRVPFGRECCEVALTLTGRGGDAPPLRAEIVAADGTVLGRTSLPAGVHAARIGRLPPGPCELVLQVVAPDTSASKSRYALELAPGSTPVEIRYRSP